MTNGVWQPTSKEKSPFPDGSRRWKNADAGSMLRATAGQAHGRFGPTRTYLKHIAIGARADHAHSALPALCGGWWWMGPTSSVPVRTDGGDVEYLHEECPLCRYRSAMPDVHVTLGMVDGEPACSGDRTVGDRFLTRARERCQEHPRAFVSHHILYGDIHLMCYRRIQEPSGATIQYTRGSCQKIGYTIQPHSVPNAR